MPRKKPEKLKLRTVAPAPRKQRRARRTKPPPPAEPIEKLVREVAVPLKAEPGGSLVAAPKTDGPPKPVVLEVPQESRDFLRFAAGLTYTTDLNGVTVEELAKRPPFAGVVPFNTLQEWCRVDQWVARREALATEWRRSIEAKIGQRQIQQALVDLENSDAMMHDLKELLVSKVGKVSSYEGLVNATVRVMEFRAALRAQVMGATTPSMGVAGGPSNASMMPKPKLSAEEARAAATAILKQRRDAIRAEQAKAAAAANEEKPDTPPLRLLPGQKV